MKNYNDMFKQVQKMQADMVKIQEDLGNERIEASSGGGIVTAIVNGHQELLEIEIAPEAVDPNDIDMLQDLVAAAVNEALRQSRELASQRLGSVTGGLNIPGLT